MWNTDENKIPFLSARFHLKEEARNGMAEALGKAKVNILAFMTDEAEGQSRVRLVTDNPAKAGKTWPRIWRRWRTTSTVRR